MRKRRWWYGIVIGWIGLLAAACSNRGSAELTLVAQNIALGTEIANVRMTATVAADQLNITVEYMQTAVTQAARVNQVLVSTMRAIGQNPEAVLPQPGLAATAPPAVNNAAPVETAEINAIPSDVGGAVSALTPTPAAPSLYNVVMAEGVGKNDCALAAVNSFPTTVKQIYVVATAVNIAPGAKLTSRWSYEGQEVVVHDFAPDFAINENCIWFFIDPNDAPFTPGKWSVLLELDGIPQGQPTPFTING